MTHYAYYIIAAIVLAWFAIFMQGGTDTVRERISLSLAVSAAVLFVYGLGMSITDLLAS